MSQKVTEQVAIALGANLGEKRITFEKALSYIDAEIGPVVARSNWIESEPLLHPTAPTSGQDCYLNGVVLVETILSVQEVLSRLLVIENVLGRDRTKEELPWSPRIIDLDLLLYGSDIVDEPELKVPHPHMHIRDFVLIPLCEVLPHWVHPVVKKSIQELAQGVSKES